MSNTIFNTTHGYHTFSHKQKCETIKFILIKLKQIISKNFPTTRLTKSIHSKFPPMEFSHLQSPFKHFSQPLIYFRYLMHHLELVNLSLELLSSILLLATLSCSHSLSFVGCIYISRSKDKQSHRTNRLRTHSISSAYIIKLKMNK